MSKRAERIWRFAMWANFVFAIAASFDGRYDHAAYCIGFACFSALQVVLGKGERQVVNNITVSRPVSNADMREAIRRNL